jgi:predicted acylesterase/phospholipase RssA
MHIHTHTLLQAWRRTGRDFFVCVYDGSEQTRVLNWRSTPGVVIASAVIASSALPHVMAPQQLQVKMRDGRIVPLDGPDRYFDGSLKHDVPLEQLNKTFSLNCRYTIVSQVEPHILPFFYCPRGQPGAPELFRGGRGLRGGFFLSLAERFLKLDMQKWLSLQRDVGLSPGGVQEFDDAFLQKTWGDVTILPPIRPVDYRRVFSNPTAQSMREQVRLGQSSAWPKLCMVSHRHRIERCLARCVKEAAAAVVDSAGAVRARQPGLGVDTVMAAGEWRGAGGGGGGSGREGADAAGDAEMVSVHERRHLMRERDMAHALLEQERERSESLQEALDVEQMRRIKGEEEMRGLGEIMEMDTAALRRRASSHARSPTRRSSVVLSGPQ